MKLLATLQIAMLLVVSALPEGRMSLAGGSCCAGRCSCTRDAKQGGTCCCAQRRAKKQTDAKAAERSCCSSGFNALATNATRSVRRHAASAKPSCCSKKKKTPANTQSCCREVPADEESTEPYVQQRPCTPDPVEVWVSQMPRTLVARVGRVGVDTPPERVIDSQARRDNFPERPATPPPQTRIG